MKTTLNAIRATQPCQEGWATLLKHLGKTKADDEPIDFLTILESNGTDDTLWAMRSVVGYHRELRHLGAELVRVICDEPTPGVLAMVNAAYSEAPDEEYLRNMDVLRQNLYIERLTATLTAAQRRQRSSAFGLASQTANKVPFFCAEGWFDGAVVEVEARARKVLVKLLKEQA